MLNITTHQYNRFIVNDKGEITQFPGVFKQPEFSGEWRMMGLQHVKRSEYIPLTKLAERLPTLTLLYKNGKPQYTVVDLDHGTRRSWGDGVSSLYFTDGEQ